MLDGSTRPLISNSSSTFTNHSVTVPRALITIGIIVIFMFHSFLQFSSKVEVLILLFAFSQLYSEVSQESKVHISASSLFLFLFFFFFFFCFIITMSGRRAEIRLSFCISKSQRSLCTLFFRKDAGLCIYHLFVWSNFNFLHNSQWIT